MPSTLAAAASAAAALPPAAAPPVWKDAERVVDTFTGRVVDKLTAILRGTDEAGADLLMISDRMFGPTPQAGSTGNGPQPPQARAEQIDVLLDQVAARVAQVGALASGLNARI